MRDEDIPLAPSSTVSRGSEPRTPATHAKILLGVMEDACPFAHPSLASVDAQTRVVALWDQSLCEPANDPPPKALGYGRERLHAHLVDLVARHSADGIDEEALYADPAALQRRLRDRSSHAAAVITLLAGRRELLPAHSTSNCVASEEAPFPNHEVADDAAAAAPLAVVQFPREQVDLAGARWMVVRALDGLRYLASASQSLAAQGQAPLPMVVNLSYGSVVGAHDGTALLETAMAELASRHGRMAIVLAAGNSYGHARSGDSSDARQRLRSGRRAEHRELAPSGQTRLQLYVPPNKSLETYLEVWFSDCNLAADAEQFLALGEITIRITPPDGGSLVVNRFPGMAFDGSTPAQTRAGLLCFPRVSQSLRHSMALLVVAATQISSTRIEVPSGTWAVSIENNGLRRLRVQAWVERDLVPGTSRTSQAARLLSMAQDEHAAVLGDDNTLNNIGTGAEVFRAGALTASGAGIDQDVSPYSSAPDRHRAGPEFSAVADESQARPGIRVSGNAGGATVRMNGTSVAAPQAARWIANRLAAGDTLADIRHFLDAQPPVQSCRRGRLSI